MFIRLNGVWVEREGGKFLARFWFSGNVRETSIPRVHKFGMHEVENTQIGPSSYLSYSRALSYLCALELSCSTYVPDIHPILKATAAFAISPPFFSTTLTTKIQS